MPLSSLTPIPDFLPKPELSSDGTTLCRLDLAVLRAHIARIPDAIPFPANEPAVQASLIRLLSAGMIEEIWSVKCAPETIISDYGYHVVRANASCLDGSEDHPLCAGRLRADFEDIFALANAYEAALALAMADTLPPHPPTDDIHPLAVTRAAHDGIMGFGAAVVDWVRRRWCYARILAMIYVAEVSRVAGSVL